VLVLGGCAVRAPVPPPLPPPPAPPASKLVDFVATAYALDGKTAAGVRAKPGIVAADPAVLPLGTRIRVHDAGPYSGEYTVGDTGARVKGRRIDIFVRDRREAKRFGQKSVRVERLSRTSRTAPPTAPADTRRRPTGIGCASGA